MRTAFLFLTLLIAFSCGSGEKGKNNAPGQATPDEQNSQESGQKDEATSQKSNSDDKTQDSASNNLDQSMGQPLGQFSFSATELSIESSMIRQSTSGSPFSYGIWVPPSADVGSDRIEIALGNELSANFRPYFDANQGSLVFFIQPFWKGNDNKDHLFFF